MKTKSKTRNALGGLRLGLLLMAASISSAARADGENLIIAGTAPVDVALAATVWTSTTGFAAFQGTDSSTLWASGSDANHGYIQQAVSTTAGAEHTLTFDWNVYAYFGGNATGRVRAIILNADTMEIIADTGYETSPYVPYATLAFNPWRSRSLTFTPTVSNILVRLTGNQGVPGVTNFRHGAATLVTNIAMTAVPLNTPPTADAGADQSVYVGATVALNGSASFDVETASQDLGYAWSLSGPVGSAAVLTGGDTATPSFVADVAGSYALSLTVTDAGSLTGSDQVIITVEDPKEAAKLLLTLACDEIAALAPSQMLKKNNAKELCKEIQEALKEIDKCKFDHAIKEVQEVMARTDGVPLRGAVDGKGSSQDWITDGAAQGFIYGLLSDAVDALKVAVCAPKKHKGDHEDDDDHEDHDGDHKDGKGGKDD